MIVLYETTSRENAAALERDLVDHNWEHHKMAAEIGGGGGKTGAGWYYLYIVREAA